MHTNYILKQAIKTAFAILAISAHTNIYALGLGNIEVNSHLGQPLRANIKVQGASELKNVDCFRVVNDYSAENQLASANFKLSKVVDDVAILTVTTSQVLNEPIMNLSILAECDANMRRDYVLLLDPPLTTTVGNSNESSVNNSIIVENKENSDAPVTASADKLAQSPASQTVKAAKKNKKTAKQKTVKSSAVKTEKREIIL